MSQPLILLTTDFSDEAAHAYAPTIELAKKIGAKVRVVHVVSDLIWVPAGAPLAPRQHEPDLIDKIELAQKKAGEVVASIGGGPDVDFEVLSGEVPEKILAAYAEEKGARFIAIASHGRSGIRRVVLGSFAESVLRQTLTPVIIYPVPH